MSYILNQQGLAKEIFENEIVIINILSGKYYSINGESGVSVIKLLEKPINKDQIYNFLTVNYNCGGIDIKNQIDSFIESLLAEKIILETNENEFLMPKLSKDVLQYKPLELKIYDDMQELIQLDPIHDITVSKGWPNKK
jgi:hypothetical protein